MFRALLALHQETLHKCSFGDYCVLKLTISLCCAVCIQYALLDYIGFGVSESENAVSFVSTGCRCGLVSGYGKTAN
jgi:hypothetical protein